RHFFFVEPIGILVGALEFLRGNRKIADSCDDGAALFAESPPTHAHDEGDGDEAHGDGQEPWIFFICESKYFNHRSGRRCLSEKIADCTAASRSKASIHLLQRPYFPRQRIVIRLC